MAETVEHLVQLTDRMASIKEGGEEEEDIQQATRLMAVLVGQGEVV